MSNTIDRVPDEYIRIQVDSDDLIELDPKRAFLTVGTFELKAGAVVEMPVGSKAIYLKGSN